VAGKSIPDAVRIITEDEPTRLRTVNRTFRGDLDVIFMHALEKDPRMRYSSAAELAGELERYLADRPIQARPPSTIYQLKKFARRNKALVTALTSVMIILVIATAVSVTFGIRATRAKKAELLRAIEASRKAYIANMVAAQGSQEDHDIVNVRRRLGAVDPEYRQRFEWRYLNAHHDRSMVTMRIPGEPTVKNTGGQVPPAQMMHALACHPGNRYVVTGGEDGVLRVWDSQAEEQSRHWQAHPSSVTSVAFTADGTLLISGCADGSIGVWSFASGENIRMLTADEAVAAVAVHDNEIIAASLESGTVKLFDLETGTLARTLEGHQAISWCVDFNADGSLLASASDDGTARIWSVQDGSTVATIDRHKGKVKWVDFHPDGRRLATGSADRTIGIYDALTGATLEVLSGHTARTSSVHFSPDGNNLMSTSNDRTVRIWNVKDWSTRLVLTGHEYLVLPGAFFPDGQRVATVSYDGTVRLWDGVAGQDRYHVSGIGRAVTAISFLPDGFSYLTISQDRILRLWDAQTNELVARKGPFKDGLHGLAVSGDGRWLAVGSRNDIRVFEARSGREHAELTGHEDIVFDVAFDASGRYIASASKDKTVRIWRVANGELVETITGDSPWSCCAYARDADLLAAGNQQGAVKVWRTPDYREVMNVKAHQSRINTMRILEAGNVVVSAGFDGRVVFHDIERGVEVEPALVHDDPVLDFDITPDARSLVTATIHPDIFVWDMASHELVVSLAAHANVVSAAAFSPNGSQLVTGSMAVARVWDTQPYRNRIMAIRARDADEDRALNWIRESSGGVELNRLDTGQMSELLHRLDSDGSHGARSRALVHQVLWQDSNPSGSANGQDGRTDRRREP
ncbi:MAG: WD40 repeat domain-containing protein, partial [Planctomycetota bacterium]